MAEIKTLEIGETGKTNGGLFRADIDTSAPFESVKEAVTRFGGLGFWKPTNNNTLSCDVGEVDVSKVEEQAAELEKELILKERDTLEVLKELEATKLMVEELKSKLQKEEATAQLNTSADFSDEKPYVGKKDEEKENNPNLSLQNLPDSSDIVLSSSSSVILMELKQAKLNLTKTTSDLAEIRASVELYNKKIERERTSLEKTRERLSSNMSKISSLEEEINQTRSKLQESDNAITGDAMVELQRLNTEAEKYKKLGEVAKFEVMRVMSEIELTKTKIKTAEIRLVAARKMKEASRSAEAVVLSEIKALEKSRNFSLDSVEENTENITLTLEEYSSLRSKARDAEEFSNLKVLEAVLQVDEANVCKEDIIKQVEEAMEEVETSKKALEEALNRVDLANSAKLSVEEALRKWRSENGERRRSTQNSTKFKNPCPLTRRRDSWMLDLNGVNLVGEETSPVLKPTLSIGQILSRKLFITEEFETGKGGKNSSLKRKVSLGQMLGKLNGEMSSAWKMDKDCVNPKKTSTKRKKFSFARFSVVLPKQSQQKKQPSPTTRLNYLNFLTSGCKGEVQQVDQLAVLKM